MRRPSRRTLLALVGSGLLGAVALRLSLPRWLRPGPVRGVDDLSGDARRLAQESFADLPAGDVWDVHAHVVGLGESGSGCWVHPRMQSHWNPLERLRFDAYLAASGVERGPGMDEAFLERLIRLQAAANPDGRVVLLAFDLAVDESGRELRERSSFHTPDEHVLAAARRHPLAEACVSVHPYRVDALERLERAAEAGAVAVKWLPAAMGIDPASARCDAFYELLARLGLPLLTHAGAEMAVAAASGQELGNPLRLRRPLEHGVRVLVAHCASRGTSLDLDRGGGSEEESFELFLRLLSEPEHEGRLFGEISALPLINRCGEPLERLLRAGELHPRLVNGSDYPLIAVDPLVSTRLLAHRGLLAPQDRGPLEEIFDANPLLFDYVLKRRLRLVEGGAVHRFAPVVFRSRRVFA